MPDNNSNTRIINYSKNITKKQINLGTKTSFKKTCIDKEAFKPLANYIVEFEKANYALDVSVTATILD